LEVATWWGKRGPLKVAPEINGLPSPSSLYPTGRGTHFFIVNKRMQAAGKATPGKNARLRRAPDTVTAFWLPAGMNDEETMEVLRSRYNVVLAGGQGELAGQILRIGHMGHVSEAEIDEAVGAVKQVLAGRTAAAR